MAIIDIMIQQERDTGSAAEDLRLVSRIAAGDPDSWEEFVTRFTAWSIYRARKLCEGYCRRPDAACGLLLVSNRLNGGRIFSRGGECGTGMDSYIWIMEQLKKRVPAYGAKNNCRLSTFVWRILNSKEFYVDWLRWKYGRVF
ncbi:MAG: hypothetical protein IEMM0002_0302 [bacterium]|nr:MAG: hypothetical protein IEMM0002_0302 [bacterium]